MDRKDRAQVRDISKKIKQGIRTKDPEDVVKYKIFFEEFNGIRSSAGIKTRKKVIIVHMRNKSGNIEATMNGIATVFAKFYKDKNDERKDKLTRT